MKSEIFRKLLKRYTNRQGNKAETQLVDDWYNSFNQDVVGQVFTGQDNRRRIRNEMHAAIASRIHTRPALIRHLPLSLKIAASLMLFVSAGLLIWQITNRRPLAAPETFTYINTGTTGMKKLQLPDSTVIWLNAGSRMHYSNRYGQAGKRNVVLDEGEAYFEVKHDKNRPFIVKAGTLKIQVLGTSFNIYNYKALADQKVTVLTGKVAVSDDTKLLDMLTPGRQINIERNSHAWAINDVKPAQSNAWIDNRTYLSQATFDELALAYLHHFGLHLKGNEKVYHYRYSIQFDPHTRAEDAAKAICSINQSHYRKEANGIVLY